MDFMEVELSEVVGQTRDVGRDVSDWVWVKSHWVLVKISFQSEGGQLGQGR